MSGLFQKAYLDYMSRAADALPQRRDLLIAAALIGLSQVEVWLYSTSGGGLTSAWSQALCACWAAWWQRWPSLAAIGLTGSVYLAAAVETGEPASLAAFAATFLIFVGVGRMSNRWLSWVVLVCTLGLTVTMLTEWSLNLYLAIAGTSYVIPWLIGALWLRRLTARRESRAREETTRAAIAAERRRLAQELHDVVSHNVGMMMIQAGAGDVALDRHPERARDSLAAIEQGGRETLVELRRLLGVLRTDEAPENAPVPGLSQLPTLIENVRRSGLDVRLQLPQGPSDLSPGLDVTAFRIVQEALTNVVKHAGATRADVTVAQTAQELSVEISDCGQGAAAPPSPAGLGLVGIAERVAVFGGDLDVGPRPDGGFVVRARFPLGTT